MGRLSALALLLLVCLATAGWIEREDLKERASKRTTHSLKEWTVNLDLDPADRWKEIGEYYAPEAPKLLAYINEHLKGILRDLPKVAAKLINYRGFETYSEEMKGYAAALKIPIGDMVIANMIYQFEEIGVNCSGWNTTGPGCKKKEEELDGPPGWCTSTVAQDENGVIWHGRNLDWNLNETLREFMINVRYTRGDKTVLIGTNIVAFVGIINGMIPGVASTSINARHRGGFILTNLLDMLFMGAQTPSQHIRRVLETSADFKDVVSGLHGGNLINDIYYTVAGSKAGEGVVITRSREPVHDAKFTWWIAPETTDGWFRLQTNYDHWLPVPAADNRRDPGNANMKKMGQKGVNEANLLEVMKTWPTFNPHTDFTGVFCPAKSLYTSMYWVDPTNSTKH
eukprot:NODE_2476_length_1413_cov_22.419380_g2354_i0.p1 GENE.NODE_2476_length_1413_cov_22.419380_g2354_i0~~NODE_2476_length_1413_cov_22.419380_g2354_i0.p1  ORF type:complete len:398 (-),score=99.60 NODE_2476_length_1413_cov_22.419380_g2354_i0:152-1345(-)